MSIPTRAGATRRPPSRHHPVRVALIDKDHIVRHALTDLLEWDPAVEIVGEADTVAAAQALLPRLRPEVVIVDPHLPDGDGLDLCRAMRTEHPGIGWLVLSADIAPEAMLAAVHAGAAGYMVKDLTELDVAGAVKAIATGHSHLDRRPVPSLTHPLRHRTAGHHAPALALTTIEMTILLLLAHGLTNKQIAHRLFFSESAIRNHIIGLTRKLGLDDRTDLTEHAAALTATCPCPPAGSAPNL
ncbi:response regulator [Nocardia sp. SYP-A9097]|uniref:response regulator n=1 Tax=Nocardia sp. SYP-A9097 TaxID=2663237 RepID=UPI00129A83CE|nr:response regulator transcription factor [Nocardia sp. SYP-A9097]MRH86719.1 response regulator [Nocardia sp. SYP-A9097]